MSRKHFVNIASGVILIGAVGLSVTGGAYAVSWLLGAPIAVVTVPVVDPVPPAIVEPEPSVKIQTPANAVRYDSIADYFRAGNPNATTYRLGEPWIERKSFSRSKREKIHRENGGCCQVCGSTSQLELEHRRGLQNGGGNERSNLGTLCHECHGEKTSMDKSLRRQREKLLADKRRKAKQ